jgi:MFS family permease
MHSLRLFRRNPAFAFLWVARMIAFIGETLSTTALVLYMADKNSATLLSTVLAAQTLPRLLGPLWGSVVDRVEQRKLTAFCFVGRAISVTAILFVLDIPSLLPLLAAVSTLFLTGYSITGNSILPHLVGEDELPAAIALSGLGLNAAIAIGPVTAGALFELIGVRGLLGASAAMFLLAILTTSGLPKLEPLADPGIGKGVIQSTWAGIRYIGEQQVTRAVGVSLFLTVIFAAYGSVALVFLVQDELGASPAKYGMVQSFYGIGMVLAPLLSLRWMSKTSPKYILFGAILLIGLGNLLTGLASSILVVIVTLSISGMGNGLQNLANDTIIQKSVPRQVLGRLFGSIYSGAFLAATLAFVIGGPILDLTSPRFVYITAGGGVLFALIISLALFSSHPQRVPAHELIFQEQSVESSLKG